MIRVTATDLDNPEDTNTHEIQDDYVLTTAGMCQVTHMQVSTNGDGSLTHVVTIKGVRPMIDETRVAGTDGKHACPYKTCERRVSMHLFACRAHWMKVPAHLRAALYAAVRGDTADTYLEVRAECVEAMNSR